MKTEFNSVIYFDGVCNLCNFWVRVVKKIDRKSRFELRSLQSIEGQEFIKKYQLESGLVPDSVVYCRVAKVTRNNPDVYFESNAILYILKDSGFLGKVGFGFLWLIPPFIRNSLYQWVARNRYKWFGTCEL